MISSFLFSLIISTSLHLFLTRSHFFSVSFFFLLSFIFTIRNGGHYYGWKKYSRIILDSRFSAPAEYYRAREIKGEYRLSVQRRAIKFGERKGDLRVVKKEKPPPLFEEPINACPALCFRTKTSISSLPSKWTTVECSSTPPPPIFHTSFTPQISIPLAPYIGTPFLSHSVSYLCCTPPPL